MFGKPKERKRSEVGAGNLKLNMSTPSKTKKKPAMPKEPPKKLDLKLETIQREVRYTDAQITDLMRLANLARKEYAALEAQLESAKEDYKAKMSAQELKLSDAMNRADRGFEMRSCEAVVEFNSPAKGRKTYYVHEPANMGDGKGPFIREEDMSASDMQTDFIADKKPSTEQQPGLGLPVEKEKESPLDEPLMLKILAAIKEKGICNTVFVQRNFKLGYGPAVRMLDALEKLGHVGPEGSDKQREILVNGKAQEKPSVKTGDQIPNPVPPVPTAETKTSTAPWVSSQISRAVVRLWTSGFAGFLN